MVTNTLCYFQIVNEDTTMFFEGERILDKWVVYDTSEGYTRNLELTEDDRRYLIEWLGGVFVPTAQK